MRHHFFGLTIDLVLWNMIYPIFMMFYCLSVLFFPILFSFLSNRVINIAAVRDSSTSVAMTENFEVYMWGVCGGVLNLS